MSARESTIHERQVIRSLSCQIMADLARFADILQLDMVGLLVFTGIWTANTEHLVDNPRYADLTELPPDYYRRPITLDDLAQRLRMPKDLVAARVDELEAMALVEIDARGIRAPTGVFTREELLRAFQAMAVSARSIAELLSEHGVDGHGL